MFLDRNEIRFVEITGRPVEAADVERHDLLADASDPVALRAGGEQEAFRAVLFDKDDPSRGVIDLLVSRLPAQ